jgi:alpha-1,6-mannosyltransferase
VLSFCIDSYFWQRWLYPEGELFYFNVVLGRSVEYGRSPWHWYVSSALPRALSGALLCVPIGVLGEHRRRLLHMFAAPLVFVVLYSALAHKELRFVVYVVPLLNAAAAAGIARVYDDMRRWRRARSQLERVRVVALASLCAFAFFICIATTAFGAVSAAHNYAGGEAFARAHRLLAARADERLAVHIDVLAAQSGVSRFGERRHARAWRYSKDERRPLDTTPYTHLITETARVDAFVERDVTWAFAGFDWRAPVKRGDIDGLLVLRPTIYLLERRAST